MLKHFCVFGVSPGEALGFGFVVRPVVILFAFSRKSVDEVLHPTYRAAAQARGLVEDDSEYFAAMEEAAALKSPAQLRLLLAHTLMNCDIGKPMVWDLLLHRGLAQTAVFCTWPFQADASCCGLCFRLCCRLALRMPRATVTPFSVPYTLKVLWLHFREALSEDFVAKIRDVDARHQAALHDLNDILGRWGRTNERVGLPLPGKFDKATCPFAIHGFVSHPCHRFYKYLCCHTSPLSLSLSLPPLFTTFIVLRA